MATSMSGRRASTGMSRGDRIPKGYEAGQLQQMTPEQIDLLKQGMSNLGPDSYLSRLAGGDQSMFEELEAPAMQQFNQQLGGIASRFSGQGMGARRSSGFGHETTKASSDFASQLKSQRMDLRNQAMRDLMNMSNQMLGQRPYERTLARKPEEQSSGWGSIAGGIAGGVGGAFFGNPILGAQAGAALGSQF